jgi:hypothetical protein
MVVEREKKIRGREFRGIAHRLAKKTNIVGGNRWIIRSSTPPKPTKHIDQPTRHINENGYWVTEAGKLEHRLIYKRRHGRIPKGWHVHHIDQCKTNNDIENLIAIPESLHNQLHAHMRENNVTFNRAQTEQFCGRELNQRQKLEDELKDKMLQLKALERSVMKLKKELGRK